MAAFIFTSILMVSLSTVLYLMVRALPRIVEEPRTEESGLLDRWAHSQIPEKVDVALNGFLLKLLRRIKVFVLKFDNTLSKHLQRVKPEDTDKKPNIDFKEIAGKAEENGIEGSSKI